MTRRLALLLFASLLAWALFLPGTHSAQAEEAKYAAGRSSVAIEGLQVELNIPEDLTKEKPAALVVILHGAGGTATGMAGALNDWGSRGYVVCAPKSKGQVWSDSDLAAVLRIAALLKKDLPIDPKRVHVVGYSNGGYNLGSLAFNDDLRPCSATWVGSGCRATKVPKWALTHMGVLALAGSQDANASAAGATVEVLEDSVRSVGVRYEAGLGHQWPTKLMPYFAWWMDAMDGRFVPGVDMNFDWGESLERAVGALAGQKKGGVLVYAYDATDVDKPIAKLLQNELLMDQDVQFYGRQLEAVKLDFAQHKAALEAYGVTSTPALLVLKVDGKKKRVLLEKDLKARKIASALKGVAPTKKPGR
jgi:predicted esterase